MEFKALKVIDSNGRNVSIDVFRGFAVLSVLLYHFDSLLPFGNLGVDLFFVISGFLVSGLLLKDFTKNNKINYFSFILQRGFKIWPSYYTFLILGNLFVYLTYSSFAPQEAIPLYDLKRYIFFYQNYTGLPQSNVFYHVWSLCVEEHFYILLPLLLIFLQKFNNNKNKLFLSVGAIICLGIVAKVLVLYFTRSKDTYAATHNRIDALGWGVMLNLINTYYPHFLKNQIRSRFIAITGIIILIVAIGVSFLSWKFYNKVLFHSLVPFSFCLMIAGTYYLKIARFKFIRIVAYYSYNLYLWHPIFATLFIHYFNNKAVAFITYIVFSASFAFMTTTLVEEPCLLLRKKVLSTLFKKKTNKEPAQIVSMSGELNAGTYS